MKRTKNTRKLTFLLLLAMCALFVYPQASSNAAEERLTLHSESIVLDTQTNLMWQLDRSRRFRSADDVYSYLAELNEGEYSDWRLPTQKEVHELFLLFDLQQQGDIDMKLEGSYWHRDENDDVTAGSWELGDECGPSRVYYPERAGYVRAVRP